ncbi:MAG TPA: class I SAM-dependent methyltransferase [Candidatus Didemnitutus sp.]|nr:class I SAM-dependent methyltransferase [Candidatus Didemnitutus sp.]
MLTEEYRKMVEVEDVMWYYRALHTHVTDALASRVSATAAVLDAGCGTGGLLRRWQEVQPGWRLTGLDFSPVACEFARTRTMAEIVEGSIMQLPFDAERFDAIVSCDVVCQVNQPLVALREIARCLRPGGVVVLTMPAYAWMYSYHDRQVGNLRRYSRGEVFSALQNAGLSVARGTYWNTALFPLAVLRRKIFPGAETTSDVHLFPPPVEALFNRLTDLERAWLRAGARLPFGNSVLAVAVKPAAHGR